MKKITGFMVALCLLCSIALVAFGYDFNPFYLKTNGWYADGTTRLQVKDSVEARATSDGYEIIFTVKYFNTSEILTLSIPIDSQKLKDSFVEFQEKYPDKKNDPLTVSRNVSISNIERTSIDDYQYLVSFDVFVNEKISTTFSTTLDAIELFPEVFINGAKCCIETLRDNLINPMSLQVHEIELISYRDSYEMDFRKTDPKRLYYRIDYSAQNGFGGYGRETICFQARDDWAKLLDFVPVSAHKNYRIDFDIDDLIEP